MSHVTLDPKAAADDALRALCSPLPFTPEIRG